MQQQESLSRYCRQSPCERIASNTHIDSFADNQTNDLRALENLFVGNALRFKKVHACEDTNTLPIPDDQIRIRERLIKSIRDGASLIRSTSSRIHKPEILRIADQFLAALKKIHTKGPDESKCKGSVYRMSRSTTLDDIVVDPRKIRQRFIDNQINNAKKKRDGKELK
ncbi:hypothetical protein BZA77DRAFT_291849 [Pyronema omphalodes]|nr:hypothetical protein BZA77DRAFT_291849 [Pyronema omphalodes]